MALTAPGQSLAHYIHASTDRFSPAAVRDLTKRLFDAAAANGINSSSLSLTYDNQDHIFVLNCQNTLINGENEGHALDAIFSRLLKQHIAIDEGELTRFVECLSGDPFDDYDPDAEREETPPPVSRAFTAHVANFHGVNTYGKAKAFRLRELPLELSLRAKSRQKISNIENMLTLRRTGWDERSQQHTFDGNVGRSLPRLSESEDEDLSELFALLAFTPFVRTDAMPKRIMQEAASRQWEFVGPPPDTVEGWLEGQGQTRQLDPNARPEIAKDAIKFTGDPSTRHPTAGRLRLPKGVDFTELQVDEEENMPEDSEAQRDIKFLSLMKAGGGDDSDSEESDDSQKSNARALQRFADYLQTKPIQSSKTADLASPGPKKTAEPEIASLTNALIIRPNTRPSVVENRIPANPSSTKQDTISSQENFPTYDRRYAKVDNWGLTGDPAKQALWEMENASSLSSHRKRTVRTYDSTRMERAEFASSSSEIDGSLAHVFQSKTPMTYKETVLGGNEPWANNVVKPRIQVREGELINTDGSIAATRQIGAPRVPPGLGPPGIYTSRGAYPPTGFLSNSGEFPPLGHVASGGTEQRKSIANVPADSLSPATTVGGTNTQHSTPATSISAPIQGSDIQQKQRNDQPLIQFDDDDDAPIVERLEPQNAKAPRLFRTMQQQATKGKKQKSKPRVKKASTSQTPVLERPSPPTSSKPSKDNSPFKTDAQSSPSKPDAGGAMATKVREDDQVQEAIIQHLSLLLPDVEEAKLTVQFGLALLADGEALASSKASRIAELQEKLDLYSTRNTDAAFITAIGRARVDGVYLLRLPDILARSETLDPDQHSLKAKYFDCSENGLSARLTYEIEIQVPGYGEWVVKFDQEQPEDAVISPISTSQPKIYIHYPQRVWDARIQLDDAQDPDVDLQPSDDIRQSMLSFLKTLNTPAELASTDLPAFEADMPDSLPFSVGKVLAKREFSQAIMLESSSSSSTWLVTQVWDLHLRGGNGILAFAEDEQVMRERGRLWWEAALRVEGVDGLEGLVSEVVERLDPVGLAGLQAGRLARQGKSVVREEEYLPYW